MSHHHQGEVSYLEDPPSPQLNDDGEVVEHKKEPIKVCIRIRPLNAKERKRGDETVVDFDNVSIGFNPKATSNRGSNIREKVFTFDKCFGPNSTQDDIFSESGITTLLKYAVDGFSSTIFAYGQTGSGKTYTIIGNEEDSPGILQRASMFIFDYISHLSTKQEDAQIEIKTRASCLEIYQETVNDLLNTSSQNLPVRWSNRDGFFVENLCVVEVDSLDELMTVLNEGISNRKVASHDLNKDSSRSHAIFTIQFEVTTIDIKDGFETKKFGSVRFVDLAGSEKLKASKSKSVSETSSINKSLLTLGKVISALSSQKKENPYVPYRDSKLTKLLMDSLGGEAKTMMIGCITPSSHYAEESHRTLTYSSRVKKIKNIPILKLDPKEKYIMKLKEEIKGLRDEIAIYKSKSVASTPDSKVRSNVVTRSEYRSAVIEFPAVERRRVSTRQPEHSDQPSLHEQKLPYLEKRRNDDLRAATALTKIIDMNESVRDEEEEQEKRKEINQSIESLKSLLEEERLLNLEKIPQLKAKIKLLSEDNRRWKRIVRRNMDFDSEEYDKIKLENKLLKKFLEENNIPNPLQDLKNYVVNPSQQQTTLEIPEEHELDDSLSVSDRDGKESRISDVSDVYSDPSDINLGSPHKDDEED